MSTITEDEWYTKYKPVANHIDPNASWGGLLFETYGDELEYVKTKVDENRVWTWLEGDDGSTSVSAGYSIVNRLGYFITEEPFTDLNQWWQAEEAECGECETQRASGSCEECQEWQVIEGIVNG